MSILRTRMLASTAAFILTGCTGEIPPAPSPVINPQANRYFVLRVVPNDLSFDHVKAKAHWSVRNEACAPKHPISGVPIVKGVDVPADVETDGSTFVVRALTDRFSDDSCRWGFDAISLVLLRGNVEVGFIAETNRTMAEAGGAIDYVCAPATPSSFCTDRAHYQQYEAKLRAMYPTAFTVRVEQVTAHNDLDLQKHDEIVNSRSRR